MTSHRFLNRVRQADLIARTGAVRRVLPTYIEADGPNVPVGSLCTVETKASQDGAPRNILAEVVSIHADSIKLAPFNNDASTFFGARVAACAEADRVPVGDGFAGRVVNAMGAPIDSGGPITASRFESLTPAATPPLSRASPMTIVETGIRAIDGILTLGRGQRVGIFAASGVGKTKLVTQLANQTEADRCVICLVGERGREVEALWSNELASHKRAQTTIVAATSDESAAMRARAGAYALALADHWRQKGEHVLLIIDSVTRLAMALREIGLAAGEPPTVRAYTPSVFSIIPKLVEQCGALKSGGAITTVMTVLSETDDVDDPISEMMKSLLDGHIILSRDLAERGHFPAIDVPRSISRLANGLRSSRHNASAAHAIELLSTYEASRTLIETGIYVSGASAEIDQSLGKRPALLAFLQQRPQDNTSFVACEESLASLAGSR